jgi:hypothetical protein
MPIATRKEEDVKADLSALERGKKGGSLRAMRLSGPKKKAIAKKAARARWSNS